MTLPDFLGIGAQRSGTTWLDAQLRSHPAVFLPAARKELHFFDRHYGRGLEWYQRFFPADPQSPGQICVGEITPAYLYHPQAASRIHRHLPDGRFLVVLRNPVDRAYSHYGMLVGQDAERRSFLECLEQRPEIFARGLYHHQLRRFLRHFGRDQFLVEEFESMVRSPASMLDRLAVFLRLERDGFGRRPLAERTNPSHRVRFARPYALLHQLSRYLASRDRDWLARRLRGDLVKYFFGKRGPLSPLDPGTRGRLLDRYEDEIQALETLLDRDFSGWRRPSS